MNKGVTRPWLVLLIVVWSAFSVADEQSVYRCELDDGTVKFTSSPCSGSHEKSGSKGVSTEVTDEKRGDQRSTIGRMLRTGRVSEARQYAANPDLIPVYDEVVSDLIEVGSRAEPVGNANGRRATSRGVQRLKKRIQELSQQNAKLRARLLQTRASNRPASPGSGGGGPTPSIGMCMGDCASEQGICTASCQGDSACISKCAAAHGRCVARCSR